VYRGLGVGFRQRGVLQGRTYFLCPRCAYVGLRSRRPVITGSPTGFRRFLAVIQPIQKSNGVQGVAGSNPAAPTEAPQQDSFLWSFLFLRRVT